MPTDGDVGGGHRGHLLGEAWALYGNIFCKGCDSNIDLSDAETQQEAVDIWNNHSPCGQSVGGGVE